MPLYAPVWNSLEHAHSLDRNDPASASAIKSLPWVADGIDDTEREYVQQLAYFAAVQPSVFDALITKSWVSDAPDETEGELMAAVRSIAEEDESAALLILALPFLETIGSGDGLTVGSLRRLVVYRQSDSPNIFDALIEKPWVRDGLDPAEQEIVENIRRIADNSETAALRVIALPFLDTLEPDDAPAVESLASLAAAREGNNLPVFDAVIKKRWVADGLDEAERDMVEDIRLIADSHESAALQTLALPFLDTVDPDDGLTVSSFRLLVVHRQSDSPNIFNALIEKPWVADGLDEAERVIVGNIRWIADHDESVGLEFLTSPFLDTIEPEDSATLETLFTFTRDYGQRLSIDPISALIQRSWVADGLDPIEQEMIGNIRWIADNSKSAALRVIALPFLDTLEPDDGPTVESFAHLLAYAQRDPLPIFDALVEMSWVADGLDEAEMKVVNDIRSIAYSDEFAALLILALPFLETIEPDDGLAVSSLRRLVVYRQSDSANVFDTLIEKSWVADGLGENERGAVHNISGLAEINESLALILIEKPWFADELDENKLEVVSKVRTIADADEDLVLQILGMPFLDSIETADRHAMATLHSLAHYSSDRLSRIMESPSITGGITDRTARIIPVLPHFVNKDEPDWALIDTLLQPDTDLVEEKAISLPLAGDVGLTIVRTTPGSPRNMGYLEHAVRVNEEFTGVSFPTD